MATPKEDEVVRKDDMSQAQADLESVGVDFAAIQKRIAMIEIGKAPPPDWFKRRGFDFATVEIEGVGTFELVQASSGTMERLEITDKPEVILELEQDAVVEAIEKFPEDFKIRRPFSSQGEKLKPGDKVTNLWEMQQKSKQAAREALKAIVGGKTYSMLKRATMWLSKLDVSTMIGVDAEPGGKDLAGKERPTA